MNILYIAAEVPFPEGLGGSRRVYETVMNLKKQGHNALALTLGDRDEIVDEKVFGFKLYRKKFFDILNLYRKFKSRKMTGTLPKSYVEFTQFNPPQHFSISQKLKNILRTELPINHLIRIMQGLKLVFQIIQNEKIDVIIERNSSYGIGFIAAKLTHRLYFVDFITIQYWKPTLKYSDGIFAYYVKSQIPRYISHDKVFKVYTAVNLEKYNSQRNEKFRFSYKIKENEVVVVYVGGMYAWHGLEEIINAVEILKEDQIPIKAMIVGYGETFTYIKNLVHQKNLENEIILTGKIPFDDIPNLLCNCDIALSVNNVGGLGFKNIEYMAAGIPQISVNKDILRFFVRHLKEGVLIDTNDPIEISNAIKMLIYDPKLRIEIGKNARIRVEKDYSWEIHIQRILNAILVSIKSRK